MLYQIIRNKTKQWLQSDDCAIMDLIKYIRAKGKLRETQIEAIETYLFLKIKGNNKALWKLFAEGFFIEKMIDLDSLNINQKARVFLKENKKALALYQFAKENDRLPLLEKNIIVSPESLDYESIIKKIFYEVSYADYLMSLPMGAGKTYLMAAFIYLDLYFAENEPNNKVFAHNFLLLIPSGLKNSIGPSLKTIKNFDSTWVLAEPAASKLKQMLQFNFLDVPKTSKSDNKANDPNAKKVNDALRTPFANVFVVNAEKVILSKIKEKTTQLKTTEDTKDQAEKRANELRQIIGTLPNTSIFIDEVHHATKSEIKLRNVVNQWQEKGNIVTVLGFSGTPYLTNQKIKLDTLVLKETTMRNKVYYYPLTEAIKQFLKKPSVKVAKQLTPKQIIRQGIQEFQQKYGSKKYQNGTIAKLAIYCSNIEMLEMQIYPFLIKELNINPSEILRFHNGNKKYKLPKNNALEFNALDTALSQKKYVLLVSIGKEGWDCKSLTAIILPQKSRSTSKSSIVQTACRCLRQADMNSDEKETALICLNEENARLLNSQLQKEQNTTIEEINNISTSKKTPTIQRFSRMEMLKLPNIHFYRLEVAYQNIIKEEKLNTALKLQELSQNIEQFRQIASVRKTDLQHLDKGITKFIENYGAEAAHFNQFLSLIAKESFNTVSLKQLWQYESILKNIFEQVTFKENQDTYFNDSFNLYLIKSNIRTAFAQKRQLKTTTELVEKHASLLIVNKLQAIEDHKNVFPKQELCQDILTADSNPNFVDDFEKNKKTKIIELAQQGNFDEITKLSDKKLNPIIEQRDQSFHILPYRFDSDFEKKMLQHILNEKTFRDKKLELYFNGEKHLTEFFIQCFAKNEHSNHWNNVGKYTPDFLIIQRNENGDIDRILIIETKGQGFANDPVFLKKKKFVETQFLEQNKKMFGYQKFDFLYIEDSQDVNANLFAVQQRINAFFK